MADPVLYSFRRCPYAMRARMALRVSDTPVEMREVVLRDKPAAMLKVSPKGTVPVLVLPAGGIVDESMGIMHWALMRNDPENWLAGDDHDVIATVDGPFKHHLDRYKYSSRYGSNCEEHRTAAEAILRRFDMRLADSAYLCGNARTLADIASFPFYPPVCQCRPQLVRRPAHAASATLAGWIAAQRTVPRNHGEASAMARSRAGRRHTETLTNVMIGLHS